MISTLIAALVWRVTLPLSLAIIGVLVLRKPLRHLFGAQAAYLWWALVPATLLASWLPVSNLPMRVLPEISVSARTAVSDLISPSLNFDSNFLAALLVLWLCGAGASLLVLLGQQRRFVRSLGEMRQRPGGWRSESSDTGPALVGALRPRVVLPADFDARYDERERALILAHERVHLHRGDAQINALVALLRCLNWFNPLVYIAASRFRFDQEIACDAVVLSRFPKSARVYAHAMLRTQLAGQARAELHLPVGCYWQSDHPLKERIMLLKKPIPRSARRVMALCCVGALVATGALASWAAQTDNGTAAQTLEPAVVSKAPADIAPSDIVNFRQASPPKYPAEAVKARRSAKVMLKVLVGEDGIPKTVDVDKISVLRDSNVGMVVVDEPEIAAAFGEASIAAAKSWRFNPGLKDGKPYETYALIPIDYALQNDDAPSEE